MEFIKRTKVNVKKSNVVFQASTVERKKTTIPKAGLTSTIHKLNKQVLRLVKAI